MRLACAVALLLGSVLVDGKTLSHQLENYSFDDFLTEYSKTYDDPIEYRTRQQIFQTRLEEVRRHNANPDKTFTKGINHLSDLTKEEYSQLLGYNKQSSYSTSHHRALKAKKHKKKINVDALPNDVDWVKQGKVTAVKDQGQCGSCWSFGTAETVESHYAIKTNALTVLSEQQILDCTPNPSRCGGSGGCGGGTPELAYDKIMELGGLSSEWTYPYRSYFGQDFLPACSFNNSMTRPVAVLKDYVVLPSNEEAPILDAVANHGPVVIAVDASEFHSYESGIFNACNSTEIDLNHAVVITGYGTENGQDYWTVRNSWSPLYGEQGYIRIARTNTCGLDHTPLDGVGCSGGPSPVTVCGPCGLFYDVSYPHIA